MSFEELKKEEVRRALQAIEARLPEEKEILIPMKDICINTCQLLDCLAEFYGVQKTLTDFLDGQEVFVKDKLFYSISEPFHTSRLLRFKIIEN